MVESWTKVPQNTHGETKNAIQKSRPSTPIPSLGLGFEVRDEAIPRDGLLKFGYAFDSSDDFVWLNEKVRNRDLGHIERQTREKSTGHRIINRIDGPSMKKECQVNQCRH
jgi:hypothetical protein